MIIFKHFRMLSAMLALLLLSTNASHARGLRDYAKWIEMGLLAYQAYEELSEAFSGEDRIMRRGREILEERDRTGCSVIPECVARFEDLTERLDRLHSQATTNAVSRSDAISAAFHQGDHRFVQIDQYDGITPYLVYLDTDKDEEISKYGYECYYFGVCNTEEGADRFGLQRIVFENRCNEPMQLWIGEPNKFPLDAEAMQRHSLRSHMETNSGFNVVRSRTITMPPNAPETILTDEFGNHVVLYGKIGYLEIRRPFGNHATLNAENEQIYDISSGQFRNAYILNRSHFFAGIRYFHIVSTCN